MQNNPTLNEDYKSKELNLNSGDRLLYVNARADR